MGQCKISLKELANVRRKVVESIYDYLNRFRTLKERYFMQVPEHELVKLDTGGLDYSIGKKLNTQNLRDMAQLADRFRQVERLKAEKARTFKFNKKKVTYVEVNKTGSSSDSEYEHVEENEVNMEELKQEPTYMFKLMNPSNEKNLVEPKNENFVDRTYTLDVTKSDKIFDILVADG